MMRKFKLVVNVPLSHADLVRQALGHAGAGRVGHYAHCSFSIVGKGRFEPLEGANPHIGAVGIPETVDEEQIQVDVFEKDLVEVVRAMKAAHPYEETGYELYEMYNYTEVDLA